jgi:hypothetical protein
MSSWRLRIDHVYVDIIAVAIALVSFLALLGAIEGLSRV